MAFTYSSANVGTQIRDAVRLMVHDTHSDSQKLDDAEVDRYIVLHGRTATEDPDTFPNAVNRIAAAVCDAIRAKFAAESKSVLTDVSLTRSTAASAYADLAEHYRKMARGGAGVSFTNPSAYSNTFVPSIDALPELE